MNELLLIAAALLFVSNLHSLIAVSNYRYSQVLKGISSNARIKKGFKSYLVNLCWLVLLFSPYTSIMLAYLIVNMLAILVYVRHSDSQEMSFLPIRIAAFCCVAYVFVKLILKTLL